MSDGWKRLYTGGNVIECVEFKGKFEGTIKGSMIQLVETMTD